MLAEDARKTMCPVLSIARGMTMCKTDTCQWWVRLDEENDFKDRGRCSFAIVVHTLDMMFGKAARRAQPEEAEGPEEVEGRVKDAS